MSTPGPWTERAAARGRWLLLAGLVAALVTGVVSLFLARDDGRPSYPVAAGDVATIGDATITLVGLRQVDRVDGGFGTAEPVAGATFVLAELDVDLARMAEGGCLVSLRAGEYWFSASYDHLPAEPLLSTCAAGTSGRLQLAYQVPRRLLDRVDGVRVDAGDGTVRSSVVLPGRLG